jgi:hypothetical protein
MVILYVSEFLKQSFVGSIQTFTSGSVFKGVPIPVSDAPDFFHAEVWKGGDCLISKRLATRFDGQVLCDFPSPACEDVNTYGVEISNEQSECSA